MEHPLVGGDVPPRVRLQVMAQVFIAVAIVMVGIIVAYVVRRRDTQRMARGDSWSVPAQLERSDFADPQANRLVVVFSSATCGACARTWQRVNELAPPGFALDEVSYQDRRDLHDRYGIDAVPTLVIADAEGVVQASFVGPPSDIELAEALSTSTDSSAR